jgi:hypothetical protein
VELVEQDGADAVQRRVGQQLAQEQALGEEQDARVVADDALVPRLVAHQAAHFDAEFLGDSPGDETRRQSPGLQDEDTPLDAGVQEHLRHLRRLARAGGRRQHAGAVRIEGVPDLRSHLVDGQLRRGVRHLWKTSLLWPWRAGAVGALGIYLTDQPLHPLSFTSNTVARRGRQTLRLPVPCRDAAALNLPLHSTPSPPRI